MLKLHQYESMSPKVNRFLWIVDRIGFACTLASRWRHRADRDHGHDVQKVLLIRCDGIGDLICSIPAIRKVRDMYPSAEISLMVGPWSADIASMISQVDRVIIHSPWGYRTLRSVKTGGGFREDIANAVRMRSNTFDLAIDLRSDLLSLLPLLSWKIPRRIGRATRGGGFALTHVMPCAPKETHEIERTLSVVPGENQSHYRQLPFLSSSRKAQSRCRQVLHEHDLDPERTVLFSPGAQWKWRRWPEEHYITLASLLDQTGIQVAIVGSRSDQETARHICHGITGKSADLTGQLSLVELAAVFNASAGFVSSESGPALIASAVEARGLVLFGPGSPQDFGPFCPTIGYIHHPCQTGPCYQRGTCQNPNNWCMGSITPQEVFEALKKKLNV
jgi:ADP-heptose:LPS heptosyltransferase